jgi:hypothetical protein
MAIIKVAAYPGQVVVLQAVEGISNLHTVMFSPIGGVTGVAEAVSGSEHLAIGVARGTVQSGKLARIVTEGFVSGVICGAAVQAGDRLTITSLTSGPALGSGAGLVMPFNTITPAGLVAGTAVGTISGVLTSANMMLSGFAGGIISGYASDTISGSLTGIAFNTGRVLGRALTSGVVGSGIQMYVCVE